MQYINKIKEIAKSKNITLKELAKMIDITEAGFYAAVRKDTFPVKTVQKICKNINITKSI